MNRSVGRRSSTTTDAFNNQNLNGLPTEFGRLTSLGYAYFEESGITTLPTEFFTGATRLRELLAGYSSLGGTLPSEIASASTLREFEVDFTTLSGVIPSTIGIVDRLTNLRIVHTSMTGQLPSELFAITRGGAGSHLFHLNANSFAGTLPTEVGYARLSLLCVPTAALVPANA